MLPFIMINGILTVADN